MSRKRGFTLMEVLVVISIITLLISILSPSLSQAKRNARMAICLSGLHQFGVGWTSYMDDSQGTFMGASTGRPNYDWVTTPPAPVTPTNEYEQNIKDGRMWSYVRDLQVYKCPDDPRSDYLRTYSMSNYVGGLDGWGIAYARKQHQLAKADRTMIMLEEPDPRGYNWGSWVINPKNSGSPHNWIDWAAAYHNNGSTLGFADCHAEYMPYSDPRTAQINGFYAFTPDNPDLVKLQEFYTP